MEETNIPNLDSDDEAIEPPPLPDLWEGEEDDDSNSSEHDGVEVARNQFSWKINHATGDHRLSGTNVGEGGRCLCINLELTLSSKES